MARTNFHAVLEKRVLETIQSRIDSLANGVAVDYAHYRSNVGYIEGLRDALKIADEIEGDSDK